MPVTFATALPVQKQFVGVAKEATKGTWATPTAYFPFDTFTPDDKITMLSSVGLRGSMTDTYAMSQGVGNADISLGGAVYADTIGWALAGLLGVDTVTGAGPYVHVLTLLNTGSTGQPTSHSLTHFYGATSTSRAYTALQWNDVELSFTAQDLVKFTAKASSLLSTTQTTPTPSYTAVQPMAAWQCVCTIGGATSVVVTEATVTMSRKQDIINGLTGLQSPAQIFEGPLNVTWKISALADPSDTALLYYLNNTQPSVDLLLTQGTSAIIQVHSSTVAMTAGPFKADKDVIEIDLAGTAVATTADALTGYGPVKVTLTNSIATSAYI